MATCPCLTRYEIKYPIFVRIQFVSVISFYRY